MIRLKKHIAFLLFGIFIFPIVFQSVHIVWHHSHVYKCAHNHGLQAASKTDFHSNGENVSEKQTTCPICEYQFSINELPNIATFNAVIPVFPYSYNEVATQQQYRQAFSDKTPRAPPVFVS